VSFARQLEQHNLLGAVGQREESEALWLQLRADSLSKSLHDPQVPSRTVPAVVQSTYD
jgi:hypothetical protein